LKNFNLCDHNTVAYLDVTDGRTNGRMDDLSYSRSNRPRRNRLSTMAPNKQEAKLPLW